MQWRTITIIFIAAQAVNTWATPCFSDENLFRATQTSALVYVWSPRMVLSAQHANTARQQAQLKGLQFVAVHDGQVPDAEITAAVQRMHHSTDTAWQHSAVALQHSQALCSPLLVQRDALRHFPTAFVLQGTGDAAVVHRHPIVGAMPEAAWASSLAQRLQDGQNAK